MKTRTTQVCVRKGGNIHPWCPSEILRRPENNKVCVREKGNTYPRCLSIGREDPASYADIADLTDLAETKRSQISAIGRPRARRFDRPGSDQEIADSRDRVITNKT